jgi:uncharacterized membrane protein YfcA
MTLPIVALYFAVGGVAGVLAGLLGIGGGLIIVPMLVFCFSWQGIGGDVLMQMALGTSMASIVFTSVASFRAHHRRGAVHWLVVRRIVLGIFTGTFLGTCVASRMPSALLKGLFVIFLFYVAVQLIIEKAPAPSRQLPGSAAMFGVGNLIGAVSSLVGIGGGTLSVPFMLWCNIPLHPAIGTSAAIGFPLAVAGAVGYLYNGWRHSGLPAHSAGFIYLPALIGLVCASVLTAPLGVWLAHRLPVDRLKRIFALLLMVVGIRMIVGILD